MVNHCDRCACESSSPSLSCLTTGVERNERRRRSQGCCCCCVVLCVARRSSQRREAGPFMALTNVRRRNENQKRKKENNTFKRALPTLQLLSPLFPILAPLAHLAKSFSTIASILNLPVCLAKEIHVLWHQEYLYHPFPLFLSSSATGNYRLPALHPLCPPTHTSQTKYHSTKGEQTSGHCRITISSDMLSSLAVISPHVSDRAQKRQKRGTHLPCCLYSGY